MRQAASFLLVLLLAAGTAAAQLLSDPGLYDYSGDLDGKILIGLTLHQQAGQKVTGSYFYQKYLKDIALSGEFTGERDLVLRENDVQGNLGGTFILHFAENDPRHRLKSTTPLTGDVLTGTWTRAGHAQTLAVYLRLHQIVYGEVGHRYRVAGAEDDSVVEHNAQAFCRAVAKGDREKVARLVRYPLAYTLGSKRVKAATKSDFLSNYDHIFDAKFVARIRTAVPHNMFARDHGIMLGDGAVWFDDKGRVFALNN